MGSIWCYEAAETFRKRLYTLPGHDQHEVMETWLSLTASSSDLARSGCLAASCCSVHGERSQSYASWLIVSSPASQLSDSIKSWQFCFRQRRTSGNACFHRGPEATRLLPYRRAMNSRRQEQEFNTATDMRNAPHGNLAGREALVCYLPDRTSVQRPLDYWDAGKRQRSPDSRSARKPKHFVGLAIRYSDGAEVSLGIEFSDGAVCGHW